MHNTSATLKKVLVQTEALDPIHGSRLGTIVKMDVSQNRIWIDYEDNPFQKPLLAMLGTARIGSDDLQLWYKKVDRALLDFTNGDPSKPVIRDLFFSINEMKGPQTDVQTKKVIEVEADEIVLKGHQQITIQCGNARTVYKADCSEINQEADQINSSAKKNNRVKGGTVLLN